jgi:hypothetical protein
MNRRIALWLLVGLALACCWVAVAALTPHTFNPGFWLRQHWPVAAITAPAFLIARNAGLTVVWFILLNGAVYAIAGLIIELLRKSYHTAVGH